MSAATEAQRSPVRRIGAGWVWFTRVAVLAIFFQAVTAGRILSGDEWARTTHRAIAGLVSLAILAAGLAALAVLRVRPGGRRLAIVLVVLALCLLVQYLLGTAAADGKDTLWLHIPLGVAIFAFALRSNQLAQRLARAA
jgi:hypothetical protein